ncbi:MAG: SAM-dependent methyltransferase [Woeseia sp.]|nr:SAM-dependent methyltransferase [Woeseia sp.]|tara:strand:+ start:888 stop:1910 length:1023 start_codon:yes stop_codon:yes gene_type:complete
MANQLAETGIFPDKILRSGIRRLCFERTQQIRNYGESELTEFIANLNSSPIALVPDRANSQHYEVPAEFFKYVLGTHRKYSCCYWNDTCNSVCQAEEAALDITCERASVGDGMNVLDLGCGWGSLSLWIAKNYPKTNVTAVSNSNSQRHWIEKEALFFGLSNIRVITADMNHFSIDQTFDRVVSVEMFEHMRNYGLLFERIAEWLNEDGYFFMHIFCHKNAAYEFLDNGPADWMSRHFFSGGIMPSNTLPERFQQHLALKSKWDWNGTHYQRTADAWLQKMDSNKSAIMPILNSTYGENDAGLWWMRWRIFFLAVSELFGMNGGREWGVGHYLFNKSYNE